MILRWSLHTKLVKCKNHKLRLRFIRLTVKLEGTTKACTIISLLILVDSQRVVVFSKESRTRERLDLGYAAYVLESNKLATL